jgi:magnesium-transporting ATPase (P-type)
MSPLAFFWIVTFFTFLIALVLGSPKPSRANIRPDGRLNPYIQTSDSNFGQLMRLCLVFAFITAILATMLVFGS